MELNNNELQKNYEELDSKINRLMTVFLDLKNIIKNQKTDINANLENIGNSSSKIESLESNILHNTSNITVNNSSITQNNNNIIENKNKIELLDGFKESTLNKLDDLLNKISNSNNMIDNIKETTDNNVEEIKNRSEVNMRNIVKLTSNIEKNILNIKSNSTKIQSIPKLNQVVNSNLSKISNQDIINKNVNTNFNNVNELIAENVTSISNINTSITKLENDLKNKVEEHVTINRNVINRINQSILEITEKNNQVNELVNSRNNNFEILEGNLNSHITDYNSNISSINDFIKTSQNTFKLLNEQGNGNISKINQTKSKIEENTNKLIKIQQLLNQVNTKSTSVSNKLNQVEQVNVSTLNKLNNQDNINSAVNEKFNNLQNNLVETSSKVSEHMNKYNLDLESLQNKIEELTQANNSANVKLENQVSINAKLNNMFTNINNLIENNSNNITQSLKNCNNNTTNLNRIKNGFDEIITSHLEDYTNNMINIQKINDGNKEVFSLIDSKLNEIESTIKTNISNVSNNTNFIRGFDDIIKERINQVNEKILVEKKITQRLFNNIDFPDKLHHKTLIDFRISEGKNNFIKYHNLDDILKQSEIKNYLIIDKVIPNDISLIDFSIEENHSDITSGTISNEVHMSNEYMMFVVIPPEMKLDDDISKIKLKVKNYNLDKEINMKQFDCIRFQYTDKRNIFVFKIKMNMMYQGYYQHCIVSLVVNGYTLFEFPRYVYNYETILFQPTIHGNKFYYHIKPGKITKNVDITLPELEVDDTFIFKNKPQTLHNKKLIYLADEKISIRKKDLKNITSIIKKLKPMKYYKSNNHHIKHTNVTDDKLKNNYTFESGLLAQHIRMIESLKHLVSEDPATGLLSLDYYGFIPYLIQSMKEIISDNESYQKRIKVLEDQVTTNKANIEKIIRFNNNS